jgi:type II secretory pathway pseudopilin PulG
MTLVEILIATGILALGMMGILSLLPYAIRNTADSVHNTIGASVAKTAMASLKEYCLDLDKPSFTSTGSSLGDPMDPFSNTINLPEDLQYLGLDFLKDAGFLNSAKTMVAYRVNDERTRYGWSAQIQEKNPNMSYRNVNIDIWYNKRSEVNTDMIVDVDDPGEFYIRKGTGEENLLVDISDKDECFIWYKSDVEIKKGQNIFVASGFKWDGGSDLQYYLPVKEILYGPKPDNGGIYIRFRTSNEIDSFNDISSQVSVKDKNYHIGTYRAQVEWVN